MFRSKRTGIIFPQTTHLQVAGAIARAWGNSAFALPELPLERLVPAIEAHDRGYGDFDTVEVGNCTKEEWVRCRRRGLAQRSADPAIDILYAWHTRTLVADSRNPICVSLFNDSEQVITAALSRQSLSRDVFRRAFSIQRLCDEISYRLCFQKEAKVSMPVWCGGSSDWTQVELRIIPAINRAEVSPWPLCKESVISEMTGYAQNGYPQILTAISVPFEVVNLISELQFFPHSSLKDNF